VLAHPFLTGRAVGRLPGDAADYDIFLSYRVNSDKNLVEALYSKLKEKGLRVFWDKICLAAGKDWEKGFASGLCGSEIFVPIISRAAIKTRFETMNENSVTDNVLLEYRLALEFNKRDLITHIYPIYVGDLDINDCYGDYLKDDCKPDAPDITVIELEKIAVEHLDRLGLGTPLLPNITVKGILDKLNKNNGGFVKGADLDACLSVLANNINAVVLKNKAALDNVSPSDDVHILKQELIELEKALTERDQLISEQNLRLNDKDRLIEQLQHSLKQFHET